MNTNTMIGFGKTFKAGPQCVIRHVSGDEEKFHPVTLTKELVNLIFKCWLDSPTYKILMKPKPTVHDMVKIVSNESMAPTMNWGAAEILGLECDEDTSVWFLETEDIPEGVVSDNYDQDEEFEGWFEKEMEVGQPMAIYIEDPNEQKGQQVKEAKQIQLTPEVTGQLLKFVLLAKGVKEIEAYTGTLSDLVCGYIGKADVITQCYEGQEEYMVEGYLHELHAGRVITNIDEYYMISNDPKILDLAS